MLKIFGHPMSTCTRKVLMTLAETNTPYELEVVDFAKGEHKAPAYTSRQPFGQLPALDDDGFGLYESRAIFRYLNEKAGGKLAPSDAKGRAVMEQWISVESANFTPHAMKFIYDEFFKRPQEPAALEAAGKAIEAALVVLDARLAKSPFLAGDQLTLADIGYMPYFEYGMMTSLKAVIGKYPHVTSWWNKLSERPTWRKIANRA
jgi:glutathione S-transferase